MYTPEEHEKIVKDLVNTFNDRDELHIAYKAKMKNIILYAFDEIGKFHEENPDMDEMDVIKFVNNFVEERFKPE